MKNSEDQIVKIAKALSDKTRVRILQQIAKHGTIGCGDAIRFAGLSQPTMSHHFKILVDAGLIVAEKDGRCVRVTVDKEALEKFTTLVEGTVRSSVS
ncbi:MAG: ArsR/SmtB family transcription factor [Bacteroidota bacterium]